MSFSILLVDDSEVDLKITQKMLKVLGYKADFARDGTEAINALEKSHYEMVFMDIQMPKMNGIEATKVIRRKWYPKPIIVFITSLSCFQIECYDAGGNDFITKPLQIDDLRNSIQYYKGTISTN